LEASDFLNVFCQVAALRHFMETDHTISDSMQLYLRDIGRFPLLSAAEELQYGQQVQTFMQLQQLKATIADQLQREPSIAEWATAAKRTETDLTEAITVGNQAKRKLLESNLRFVVSIAKRYQKRNVDLLDLIQEGSLGLERRSRSLTQRSNIDFQPIRTGGFDSQLLAIWLFTRALCGFPLM